MNFSPLCKTAALPKRLPIWIALLCLGLLTQCGKTKSLISKAKATVTGAEPANKPTAPSTSGAVLVVAEGRAPAFQAVAGHLELGGHTFNFEERLGKSPDLCVFLDKVLALAPEEMRLEIPKGFTFAQMADVLGLSGIQATGTSRRLRSDGSMHNRTFTYIPQPSTGLLSLTGDVSKRLLTLDLAPQNTDLAVEFTLRLRDVLQTVVPYLEKVLPKEKAQAMRAALDAPVLMLGMPSLQKMLEQIDCRVAYFSRLDPSKPASNLGSGVSMEATESALVIENVDWLIKAIRAQMMPMLKSPASPVEIKDSEDVLEATFKGEMGFGLLALKPILRFDSKLNRLIIASNTQIMNEVVAAAGAIRGQTEFTQAWEGLSEEGSLAVYCSARQQKSVNKSILAGIGDALNTHSPKTKDAKKTTDMIESILGGANPRPTGMVMSNLTDGILLASNSSVPTIDPDTLIAIASVGLVGAIAVPNIANINKSAQKAMEEREELEAQIPDGAILSPLVRNLREYARSHDGTYPKTLTQLVEAGLVTDEASIKVSDPQTGDLKDWLYNARLTPTSPPSALALASPCVRDDGTRLVVYHNGTMQYVTEEELKQLIMNQQPVPTATQSMR